MIWFKPKPGPTPIYPDPNTWGHANAEQRDRATRVFSQLETRSVPCYQGPLFVDSAQDAKVRPEQEVASRILILWAVVKKARGASQSKATMHLDTHGVSGLASPEERDFLNAARPDQDYCDSLVWRLESILVLLWSIGRIDKLAWPSEMCDVDAINRKLSEESANSNFIRDAKLRPIAELLDQQDLILRLHWAIRDSYLNGRKLPKNLDWKNPNKWVPISAAAMAGVVQERHHALNWLLCFNDAEWDDVDTPT